MQKHLLLLKHFVSLWARRIGFHEKYNNNKLYWYGTAMKWKFFDENILIPVDINNIDILVTIYNLHTYDYFTYSPQNNHMHFTVRYQLTPTGRFLVKIAAGLTFVITYYTVLQASALTTSLTKWYEILAVIFFSIE